MLVIVITMVVGCRAQCIFNFGKSLTLFKPPQLRRAYKYSDIYQNPFQYKSNKCNVRLCIFRCFHSSREPRLGAAKLSPQEVRIKPYFLFNLI